MGNISMMDEPKDDSKCKEGDGNKNKSLAKKNKTNSCRRKKRKMKSKTSLMLGSVSLKFIDIDNQTEEIFIRSILDQKNIISIDSNSTLSTKIANSVSKNMNQVDPTPKNFLDYFISNLKLDKSNSKIKNSNVMDRKGQCLKQNSNLNEVNFVSEVDQNLIKPAKKKKKKKKTKKSNEEAIKCENGQVSEESTSTMRSGNSQVSKKVKSESGKSGDDKAHSSNARKPNTSENKRASGGEGGQKAGNSKSGKSKKSAKGKEGRRFIEHFTPKEIEQFYQLGILHSGIIRINQKNSNEAYIPPSDKGMDIFIDRLADRNRALEGDEVYYLIKDPSHHRISQEHNEVQKTAVVIAIKTRNHNRTAVGTLQEPAKNSNVTTFLPRDLRIPKIHIQKSNWPPGFEENPKLFKSKLYLAKIRDWIDIQFAEGEILKEVGEAGNIESETSAIMLMFQLNDIPYTDALIRTIPPDAATFSSPEIKKREDWRTECVFTIDPATAKDLDDAVSCRSLPNGNYLIGVHIADVTFYLEEGSALDAAASTRATTVYLVQKVYHMLPKELCELCSLTPGTDKLTFSVVFEMTPEAEVVKCDFKRSVINCCGQFSYEQVQDVIDKTESTSFPILFGPHKRRNIVEAVTVLNGLAIKLREKRFSNGALKIDQTKISFSLDEKGLPEGYSVYVNKESHRLIEEFMLLANMAVAKRISEDFPRIAFLRSHSPPGPFMLKRVKEKLRRYNIDLDISSSKSLAASLIRYSGDDPASVSRMAVLNALLAKTMNRANYYCADFCKEASERKHYALNVELYTHFTSPIRRYADVMVHRLLAASLGYIRVPNWNPNNVNRVADYCSQKKYAAKLAGEKSTLFFLGIYIEKTGPVVYDAVVFDVKDKSLDYIILDNGLQQRLYFQNFEKKPTVKEVDGGFRVIIHWPETEEEKGKDQVVDIFSVIRIQLKKSSTHNKLEAKLMRN